MAKLTTKGRAALPTSKFAGPDRSFPVPDKGHAAFAKAMATRGERRGTVSPAEKARIDSKADRVLKK